MSTQPAVCIDTSNLAQFIYKDATGNPVSRPIGTGIYSLPRCDIRSLALNAIKISLKKQSLQSLLNSIPPLAKKLTQQYVNPSSFNSQVQQIGQDVQNIQQNLDDLQTVSDPLQANQIEQDIQMKSNDISKQINDIITSKQDTQFDQVARQLTSQLVEKQALENQTQTLQQNLTTLQDTLTTLQDTNQTLQDQINTHALTESSRNQQLINDQTNFLNEINDLTQSNQDLTNKINNLENEKNQLEQQQIQLNQTLANKQNEVDNLTTQLNQQTQDNSQLQGQLQDLQLQIQQKQTELNQTQDQLNMLTQQNQQFILLNNQYNIELENNKKTITDLSNKLNTLSHMISNIKQQYQQLQLDRKALDQDKQAILGIQQQFMQQENQLKEEYAKLSLQSQAVQQQIALLKQQNINLQNQLNTVTQQKEYIEKQCRNIVSQQKLIETNLKALQQQNKSLKAQWEKANSDLQQCQSNKQELENQVQSHRQEKQQLINKLQLLTNQYNDLKQLSYVNQSQIDKYKRKIEGRDNYIGTLKSGISSKQQEIQALKQQPSVLPTTPVFFSKPDTPIQNMTYTTTPQSRTNSISSPPTSPRVDKVTLPPLPNKQLPTPRRISFSSNQSGSISQEGIISPPTSITIPQAPALNIPQALQSKPPLSFSPSDIFDPRNRKTFKPPMFISPPSTSTTTTSPSSPVIIPPLNISSVNMEQGEISSSPRQSPKSFQSPVYSSTSSETISPRTSFSTLSPSRTPPPKPIQPSPRSSVPIPPLNLSEIPSSPRPIPDRSGLFASILNKPLLKPISPRLVQPTEQINIFNQRRLALTGDAPINPSSTLSSPRQSPRFNVPVFQSIINQANKNKDDTNWKYSPYSDEALRLQQDIQDLQQDNQDLLHSRFGSYIDTLTEPQWIEIIESSFPEEEQTSPSSLRFSRLSDALRLQQQLSTELHMPIVALLIEYSSKGAYLRGLLGYSSHAQLHSFWIHSSPSLHRLPSELPLQDKLLAVPFFNSAPGSKETREETKISHLKTNVDVSFVLA